MTTPFLSVSSAVRVRAGEGALEHLGAELERVGVSRALLLCGRTLGRQESWISALRQQAGGRIASVYAGIGKEAPLADLLAAVDAARAVQADGIVALGAGSVIKAARVVAILMAERGPLEALVTRYPEAGRAISARLLAPKPPIINIPTAPTSAQARAGSAVWHNGSRLEFFDPKTRPQTIFWDPMALETAPDSLIRESAFTVHWRALMSMAMIEGANPLVRASRREAWLLSKTVPEAPSLPPTRRQDLCAAALLQNRDEDDGGRPMDGHWVARVVYALAAAVFHVHPEVTQAQAHAALTPGAIRFSPSSEDGAIAGMNAALDMPAGQSRGALADHLIRFWRPAALNLLGVTADDWPAVLKLATRNFNADRDQTLSRQTDVLRDVFNSALK